MPEHWRFHHLGVACHDLDQEMASWTAIGYAPEGGDFEDPLQEIAGRFLSGPGPRLELVAPLPGSEMLAPVLRAGRKVYHQGFETPALQSDIDVLRGRRGKLLRPPAPAVAFGGRHVAFIVLPNAFLIELIEAED
jgi:methylmalonyl-CoA/ethylmalonyl-CoA epimerase